MCALRDEIFRVRVIGTTRSGDLIARQHTHGLSRASLELINNEPAQVFNSRFRLQKRISSPPPSIAIVLSSVCWLTWLLEIFKNQSLIIYDTIKNILLRMMEKSVSNREVHSPKKLYSFQNILLIFIIFSSKRQEDSLSLRKKSSKEYYILFLKNSIYWRKEISLFIKNIC